MAKYKCKMCGAPLDVKEGQTVVTCQFCQSTQTVANADDERKENLFNRANTLRASCDFDKAILSYQSILSVFPNEPEAHWGLCLCKYGIEYVDDPATKKKIPTIHRVSYDSILKDSDYLAALSYADPIAKEEYQTEAKQIADIQNNFLSISQKEEPFDIFICYKETDANGKRTRDSVLAQEIYSNLTDKGYKVFFSRITLESKLGSRYEPYIFAALNSAKIRLVVGSKKEYFEAVWVKNEWSRFIDLMKTRPDHYLIPCYRNREAYEMPEQFLAFQGQDRSKLGFRQDLLRGIDKIMGRNEVDKAVLQPQIIQTDVNVSALAKRAEILIGDGEYDKADELLEKVLDNDPVNSQAYLLKLLIEKKFHTIEDLKTLDNTLEKNSNFKKAYDFGDAEQKKRLSSINEFISNRNEEKRLDNLYNQALKYKNQKKYTDAESVFSSISGYRDAAKQVLECTNLGKEEIYSKALSLKEQNYFSGAIETFTKIKDFKDSETQISECTELFNNAKYVKASKLKESGKFDEAASIFKELGSYQDSASQIDECDRLKTEEKKEAIYKKCVFDHAIDPAKDKRELENACANLTKIPGYKDADQLLVLYENTLNEYARKLAAEKEIRDRERAKKRKKAKKIAFIAGTSALGITGVLLLTFLFLVPNGRQGEIQTAIDAGDYEKATALIEKNSWYGDASNLRQMAKAGSAFENLDYESGIDYIYDIGGSVDVAYDSNGGSANKSSEVIKKKAAYINNVADKAGYDFHGWVLDSYTLKSAEHHAEISLKASYETITYSVTVDLNGGNAENVPARYNTEESKALPNPTRKGYTFLGWTGSNLDSPTKDYVISEGSVGNKTFKANWKANTYKVHIDLNGGTAENTDYDIVYDSNYSLTDIFRMGYSLTCYQNGDDVVEKCGKWTIASDCTLKAIWEANPDTPYIVNYYVEKLDGTGYELKKSETPKGVSDSTITVTAKNISGFTPKKISEDISIAPDGSTVLDFYYTRNSYTLSFVSNGGNTVNNVTLKYEETLPSSIVTSRSGYTFDGWYTDATQKERFDKMPAENTTAFAYYSEETKAYFFDSVESSSGVTITKAKDVSGKVVIPRYIGGKEVVAVGDAAFKDAISVTSVVLPDSVETLGASAFAGCSSLEKVEGTSNLTEIRESAFEGCRSLMVCSDFSSVTKIGDSAFKDCVSLTGIMVSESLTEIGNRSFSGCISLLQTPDLTNVISIGDYAFDGCTMLSEIKGLTMNDSFGEFVFNACENISKLTLSFRDEVEKFYVAKMFGSSDYSRTSENFYAVSTLDGQTYYVPKKLVEIELNSNDVPEDFAYGLSSLAKFSGKEAMTKIGDYGFYGCSSLYSFNGNGFNLSESVSSIGQYAFAGCTSLTSVVIPEGVTSIGYSAFSCCSSLTSVVIHEGITSIGDWAFSGCKSLTSVVIPDRFTSIGNWAFSGCESLTSVVIPEGVTSIGDYAFSGDSLVTKAGSEEEGHLVVPSSCETVGSYAFSGLGLITDVLVPDSVTSIGMGAFKGCSSLVDITLPFVGKTDDATDSASVFGYIFGYTSSSSSGTTRQYYRDSYNRYETYYYYIPTGIKNVTVTRQRKMPCGAFSGCSRIENIKLPEDCDTSSSYVFDGCKASVVKDYVVSPLIPWDGVSIAKSFDSGSGTSDDPYVIASAAQLAYLAKQVNDGNTFESISFKILNDINLNYHSLMIGSNSAPFKGTFDGDNHIIKHLSISASDTYCGLFPYLDGSVKNLGIIKSSITSTSSDNNSYVGTIAYASTSSTIENCYYSGKISASGAVNTYVGALIGYSDGTVSHCYSIGNITAKTTNYVYAGGLVGYSNGSISNSYTTCDVSSESSQLRAYAGGFVGYANSGKITKCFAAGDVSAKGSNETYSRNGGFSGFCANEDIVVDCYKSNSQILTRYTTNGSEYCTVGTKSSANELRKLIEWTKDDKSDSKQNS